MKLLIIIFTLTVLFSCQMNKTPQELSNTKVTDTKPLNIILLIGDGMGLSQVSSAFYFGDSMPNFNRFNDIGLINTSSASHKITDSGAGATAFSTGEKTYNGAIGVGVDSLYRKNIVEILSEKNYKTGIVVTCQLPHATPACFFAHVKHRYSYEDIAKQFVKSDIDYYAGGGYQYFSQRTDSINYLDSLSYYGFTVDTNSLVNDTVNKKQVYLLASNAMTKISEGRGNFLPKATKNAINFLSREKSGFFLMVEGSQIDWAGHKNNADYLIKEVLDFDKAVGVALDYAQTNNNTLVIVLADHETGGFTLAAEESKNKKYDNDNYNVIEPKFSTKEHSTTLIPVFAWGRGSEKFKGIYQNNEIFHKILEVSK